MSDLGYIVDEFFDDFGGCFVFFGEFEGWCEQIEVGLIDVMVLWVELVEVDD